MNLQPISRGRFAGELTMDPRPTIGRDNGRTVAVDTEIGAFRDVPRWIWILFLLSWATLFALFVLFFANDAAAAFAIAIATLFVLMAFGLPITMAAQSSRAGCEHHGVIQTRSGPLSVGAAATQIVLIPVAAVIGLTAFILLAM
jgi:hypothetical protein